MCSAPMRDWKSSLKLKLHQNNLNTNALSMAHRIMMGEKMRKISPRMVWLRGGGVEVRLLHLLTWDHSFLFQPTTMKNSLLLHGKREIMGTVFSMKRCDRRRYFYLHPFLTLDHGYTNRARHDHSFAQHDPIIP